jgi:predicted  nucleic acid-binding Zn-ribbon protein
VDLKESSPLQALAKERVVDVSRDVALNLQDQHRMKNFVSEVVVRLLELLSLEERLEVFRQNHEKNASTQALIESLRGNLPIGILVAHDRFRAAGKKSVAEVRQGVCAGCHLGLASGDVAALRRGDLHRCDNCGRYLYLVEEEPAEPEAPVRGRKAKRSPPR